MVWEILAERVRQYPERFARCVEAIVGRYGGRVSVFLFGSRALGVHGQASDYDLFVVVPGYADYFDEAAELRRLCRGVPVDIVLFSADELVVDGVVAQMLRGCKTIHDGLSLGLCPGGTA
ncbi:DNA polymerase, beta domain protein region [Thermoproteus uzoniensis 768-20]|uniref:DNA polymerase, beta domain protein region n=1 Tax=Thermoproteus uzoniensis (strain 768-20) TaxID=999630 RepID=F2L126_THEU7|nr:nucleotidyltransferase domain-containing protein [Thermoproteus uzoniensis]AEA11575.1 DNA polymerase, beta domain protein region [Thermoproteus uzoniensis 768-20]